MGRGKNLALAANSGGLPVARFDDVFGVRRGNPKGESATVDIALIDPGKNKIPVIRVLRENLVGLGLKEAKALIDGVPSVIRKGIERDEAFTLKSRLEAVGALVELGESEDGTWARARMDEAAGLE